jgi:hypothetical protein
MSSTIVYIIGVYPFRVIVCGGDAIKDAVIVLCISTPCLCTGPVSTDDRAARTTVAVP